MKDAQGIDCTNKYAIEIEDNYHRTPSYYVEFFKTKKKFNEFLKNQEYNLGSDRRILRKYEITYKKIK